MSKEMINKWLNKVIIDEKKTYSRRVVHMMHYHNMNVMALLRDGGKPLPLTTEQGKRQYKHMSDAEQNAVLSYEGLINTVASK